MKFKKKYEGRVLFVNEGEPFYECTYKSDCLWKLNHGELLLADALASVENTVPFFEGHICNCPDIHRKDPNCPL